MEYKDFGCYSEESVDYPVYAKKAAEAVANFEDAEKQLEVLAADIENKKVEIANTEAQIENKLAEIEAKKAEMEAKEKEIEEQNDALNNRLTAILMPKTSRCFCRRQIRRWRRRRWTRR